MTISKNSVVVFDYTLKDEKGAIIDSSSDAEPLTYIHGQGQMIKGVEDNLEGKNTGENISFVVAPKDGYGEFDETLLIGVPKNKIEGDGEVEVGTPITVKTKTGEHVFNIVRIEDDKVMLDGNHPLAGVSLHFDVDIKDVREALPEEIEQCHSHDTDCGCGGCDSECGGCD